MEPSLQCGCGLSPLSMWSIKDPKLRFWFFHWAHILLKIVATFESSEMLAYNSCERIFCDACMTIESSVCFKSWNIECFLCKNIHMFKQIQRVLSQITMFVGLIRDYVFDVVTFLYMFTIDGQLCYWSTLAKIRSTISANLPGDSLITKPYTQCVKCLMYAMVLPQSVIAFALSKPAWFQQSLKHLS